LLTTDPNTYFKAMSMICPAIFSLVCASLVALLMLDHRNSIEKGFRTMAITFFLIISALWFALLSPSTAGSATVVRIVLSGVAFGFPAAAVSIRWIRAENTFNNSILRPEAMIVAVNAGMCAAGISIALWGGGLVWNVVCGLAVSLQTVWFTYRIVSKQYIEYEFLTRAAATKGDHSGGDETATGDSMRSKLTAQALDEYFKLKRPYLDPEFRLTDLAEATGVSRTELSTFINSTLGMNFKRYVNRWRLAEYERLMSLPSNELKNPYRILPLAGFSDSRHYNRAVEQEKEHETNPTT
jgi:AraC-like DNA-binding protein